MLNYAQTQGLMRYLCPISEFDCNMTFLQADNQMKTFSKMTGGKWYQPIFDGQLREIFADIGQTIRNQYSNFLPSQQSRARWHFPQDQGRTRGCNRQAIEDERREERQGN